MLFNIVENQYLDVYLSDVCHKATLDNMVVTGYVRMTFIVEVAGY